MSDEQFYTEMTTKLFRSPSRDFEADYITHAVLCRQEQDAKILAAFFGWLFPDKKAEHGRFIPSPWLDESFSTAYYAAVIGKDGKFLRGNFEEGHTSCTPDMFAGFASRLPHEPDTPEEFWSDDDRILCPSEEAAGCLARFFETLAPGAVCVTGYYDPEEDAESAQEDKYTGYWYVTVD